MLNSLYLLLLTLLLYTGHKVLHDSHQQERFKLPHIMRRSPTWLLNKGVPLNSTLGFEKMYAISMPNRYDKRDELSILSHIKDLNITIIDAVNYDSIDKEGIPHVLQRLRENEVGCWAAHVKTWRGIVEQKISTALILEDDADWDVNMRQAMQRAQTPLSALLQSIQDRRTTQKPTKANPWMDKEWDMLFFGACLERPWMDTEVTRMPLTDGAEFATGREAPYILYNDDTVASRDQSRRETREFFDDMKLDLPIDEEDVQRQRIVMKANAPLCLTSYAISYKGALKMMYYATREIDGPVDQQPIDAAQKGWLRNYVFFPPLFDQFKVTNSYKNSDINNDKVDNQSYFNPNVGNAFHIRYGARASITKDVADM